MKIAQICPLWERVPPPAYGGIELVASLLTEGLVARGHEVTLFASGDSQTSAELKSVYPKSLRTDPNIKDHRPYDWVNEVWAIKAAGEFDILHNHCGEIPMLLANLTSTPMLTTIHGPMPPDVMFVWKHYPGYHNSISRASKDAFPDKNYVGVVYNAIDVDRFPFAEKKEPYLLFLSRVSEEKGTHHAIAVAKQLGLKLIVAGKVDRVDEAYFRAEIEPQIDGKQIVFYGEANSEEKKDLFVNAKCLLHPITWPEPFGLVMAEAMACGTPVIVFNRGAGPEVVLDGETGFVVDTVSQMVEAVGRVDKIDPVRCRQHVKANFDVPRMVEDYIAVYERILQAVRFFRCPVPRCRHSSNQPGLCPEHATTLEAEIQPIDGDR